VDFAAMEPEARQAFLRNLNEPPRLKLSIPATKGASKPRRSRARVKSAAARKPADSAKAAGRAVAGRSVSATRGTRKPKGSRARKKASTASGRGSKRAKRR
jgi:hypothetical protein